MRGKNRRSYSKNDKLPSCPGTAGAGTDGEYPRTINWEECLNISLRYTISPPHYILSSKLGQNKIGVIYNILNLQILVPKSAPVHLFWCPVYLKSAHTSWRTFFTVKSIYLLTEMRNKLIESAIYSKICNDTTSFITSVHLFWFIMKYFLLISSNINDYMYFLKRLPHIVTVHRIHSV